MSKALLVLTSVALLGLSGCADLQSDQSGQAQAGISADARAALAAAEADVKTAKSKDALWTTAANALKAAEDAAGKGDSETVLKESKIASDQAQKGLAQLNYPVLKVGN